MKEIKKCKVEGCENKYVAKGCCMKHYKQIKRNGYVLNRTIFDSNEIVILDNYAEIKLYNKSGVPTGVTKIDKIDIDIIKHYKWCLSSKGYVQTYINGKFVSIHRFILSVDKDLVVDHINHDITDNRRSNLRICTRSENSKNRLKHKNNKSGISGVGWDKKHLRWYASICVNTKAIKLGTFKNINDAIKARKEAEIKYFGEFRYKEQ